MLFTTKTLISLVLACSSITAALCAPTSNPVDAVAVRDIVSLPASLAADNLALEKVGTSHVITERDAVTDVHLAKRYLIGSPYQKRTIQLTLKRGIHGFAAGTTWIWEISYAYVTKTGGRSGHLTGNLVKGDGSFSWGLFKIDQSFISSVDGIVTAVFNAVSSRTNEKVRLTLTWAEEFTAKGATLENRGSASFFSYFSARGRQENWGQEAFSYTLDPN